MNLPVVFHFDDLKPAMDSPAQGVKGIPMSFRRVEPDSVWADIPAIGAKFCGKLSEEEIVGTFFQGGISLPLVLSSGENIIRRPQTPRGPYPYKQEEVSFQNGNAVLRGTLTLPQGAGRQTPVVVMVTGSGLQNRDEEILEHKPFAVIADALAHNGVASLRYDDRGFGESTGDAVNCTTEDLKNDALAGIDLLRHRFDNVGVLGHSEGGTIAFMLGAEGKCDFIISLAGMVVSGRETLLSQNRYLLSGSGYSPEVVEEYCRVLSGLFDGVEMDSSGLPGELVRNLQGVKAQLKSPYMQHFLNLDVREMLPKVKCPVLALNGKKDTQVFAEENLTALGALLPEGEKSELSAMEGLNHLFQHCLTGAPAEYGTIEETISEEVLDILWRWIGQVNDR